jgi:hypothetical protein
MTSRPVLPLQASYSPALEACATFMAAVQDWSNARRLYGASEAERERMGQAPSRTDVQFIAPVMAQAREVLGEADHQMVIDGGRQLAPANALSEAEAWLRLGT